MEYPKIHSLYKRHGWYFDQDKKKSPDYQKGRQSFIVGDYAEPEFGNIKRWRIDEKIDGTNIRIFWDRDVAMDGPLNVRFGGRTKDAQIPCHLLEYLQNHFTKERLEAVFPFDTATRGVLFGEGYGPKIQACGGNYRKECGFILFDVNIGGWWLKREDVKSIADQLLIPMVPDLGIMTEEEVVEFVKSKPLSQCSITPHVMEGVMCRSEPLMLFRNGKPIQFKLKCKEF